MDCPIPEYTLLDHTADLAVRVQGEDAKRLFENASKALMHIMVEGPVSQNPRTLPISLTGRDAADLLIRWLGEILYLLEGEDLVTTSVVVQHLTAHRLGAVVEAVPFDPGVHRILCEIKAVTYHQVAVAEIGDHWEATFILDL